MAVDENALSLLLKEASQTDFVVKILDLAQEGNYEALETLQKQVDKWQTEGFSDTMEKGMRKAYLVTAFATAVQRDALANSNAAPDAATLSRLETVGKDAQSDLIKKLVTSFARHAAKKEIFTAMLRGAEGAKVSYDGTNTGVFLGTMDKGDKERILKAAIIKAI